jgi:hypothetical protein
LVGALVIFITTNFMGRRQCGNHGLFENLSGTAPGVGQNKLTPLDLGISKGRFNGPIHNIFVANGTIIIAVKRSFKAIL